MLVAVADDHPLYREAVKLRLERLLPDCQVIEAGTLGQLLAQIRTASPSLRVDLALIDLNMPGMAPPGGIGTVTQAMPDTPVVLMSGAARPQDVRQAVAAGARGFLPKTMPSDLFAMAISMILAGGAYLPTETLQESGATSSEPPGVAAASDFADRLTPRERQVLVRLAAGGSNKEIGRELNLAEVTVKLHVRQILRKINARNRSEAASMAARAGLI